MKLINKDALVAEIKSRIELYDPITSYGEGRKDEANSILSLINSLKVKEVDLEHLEQEVQDFCERFDDRKESWYNMTPHDQKLIVSPTFANFAMQIAKHFFELGMAVGNKAQKGE